LLFYNTHLIETISLIYNAFPFDYKKA